VGGPPPAPANAAPPLLDWLRLSPLAPWHYRTYHKAFYFDISRAVRDLDWHPRYSNAEMLGQSYDWFLTHQESPAAEQSRSAHRKAVRQGVLWILKRLS